MYIQESRARTVGLLRLDKPVLKYYDARGPRRGEEVPDRESSGNAKQASWSSFTATKFNGRVKSMKFKSFKWH